MIDTRDIAAQLDAAACERRPLGAPFSDGDSSFDVRDAYEVQELVVQRRIDRGARVIGAKLGLTSRAKQRQMQVSEPLYGRLTSDMVVEPVEALALDEYIHVRAEPEIGFLIGGEIASPATVPGVLAATEGLFAAIELIDSRYEGFRFGLTDVIADNASAAGVVLGSTLRAPGAIGDLRLLGAVMRRNGDVVSTAAGAAALGHPAQAVAWLVDALAERGATLAAGSIVLSGALTDAIPVAAGNVVTVEIEDLGSVEVRA